MRENPRRRYISRAYILHMLRGGETGWHCSTSKKWIPISKEEENICHARVRILLFFRALSLLFLFDSQSPLFRRTMNCPNCPGSLSLSLSRFFTSATEMRNLCVLHRTRGPLVTVFFPFPCRKKIKTRDSRLSAKIQPSLAGARNARARHEIMNFINPFGFVAFVCNGRQNHGRRKGCGELRWVERAQRDTFETRVILYFILKTPSAALHHGLFVSFANAPRVGICSRSCEIHTAGTHKFCFPPFFVRFVCRTI